MENRVIRLFFYLFFSTVVGLIVGVGDFIFAKGLESASHLRGLYFPYTLFFMPFAGVLIIYLYGKYGKNSFKGMSLVFHSLTSKEAVIPKRLIPFAVVSTWLTHFLGGSAGREGVAVQIGATVANNFSTYLEKNFSINTSEIKSILSSCGIAAGFSGLFGTPLAATIFSMEILKIGILEYKALLPSLISAYTALYISNFLGIEHFRFILKDIPTPNFKNILEIIICSLIFGFVGYLFAFLLKKIKNNPYLLKLNPMKKIFLCSIFLALLIYFIHNGRYSGLGTNLIEYSFYGNAIYPYDWLFKILFTVLTLGIGFQGGEVTPLFAIGASLGAILADFFNLPPQFLAAIGYCTVFASATNTFLASVFIGLEIFGYDMTLYFFISCAIAFVFSGDLGIYSDQKKQHHKF